MLVGILILPAIPQPACFRRDACSLGFAPHVPSCSAFLGRSETPCSLPSRPRIPPVLPTLQGEERELELPAVNAYQRLLQYQELRRLGSAPGFYVEVRSCCFT